MLKNGLVVFHAMPDLATSCGEKNQQERNSEGGDCDAALPRAKLLPSGTCSSTYTVDVVPD